MSALFGAVLEQQSIKIITNYISSWDYIRGPINRLTKLLTVFRKFDFQNSAEMYFSSKAKDVPFKLNKVPQGAQVVTSFPVPHQLSVSLYFSCLLFAEALVIYITTKILPCLTYKVTVLLCSGLSQQFLCKMSSPILLVCQTKPWLKKSVH